MLKYEKAVRLLIANGYDENLAIQLPKLYIADFFDKELEKLSEAIDIFIDIVQRGEVVPDENNTVNFSEIFKMEDSDMNPKAHSGIFYEFSSKIRSGFNRIVKRKPLQDVLLSGNAMKYHSELEFCDKDPVYYDKEVIGKPEEYSDLCVVRPYACYNDHYIRVNDILALLKSKGISEESVAIIWGKYGNGPRYPKTVSNAGIYIDYNAVMKIGNLPHSNMKNK